VGAFLEMRTELQTKEGVRKFFTGVFEKYGFVFEGSAVKSTICLRDIKHKGEVVADHAWVEITDEMRELGAFVKGDKIMFRAKVAKYKKNRGMQSDYGLSNLTKVKRCA
jgi:hypothetical protein